MATQNHAKGRQPGAAKAKVPSSVSIVPRKPKAAQITTVKVDFGGITMQIKKPTREQVRARIAEGTRVDAAL